MTGGAGTDTFVFRDGDGHDTFTDFVIGQDRVDLAVNLNEAAVQALITAAAGTDTLDLGYGNILTFTGLNVGTLNAHNDFVVH